MNIMNQRLVSRLLRRTADKIDAGTCGLDDEELTEIAKHLQYDIKTEHKVTQDDIIHLGKTVTHTKLYIEQICQNYGISRATLNRWQLKGKLPMFRKDSGTKEYLYQDECDESLMKWAANETN